MAFITIDELSEFIGEAINPFDAAAETAVNAATSIIQTYTQQTISKVTGDTIKLDGTLKGSIFLPELPIIAINSVTVNGLALTANNNYLVSAPIGIIHRAPLGHSWGQGTQTVVVNYDHGYDPIPQDIKLVCLELARDIYLRSSEGTGGDIVAESFGSYSVQYSDARTRTATRSGLTSMQERILDSYRIYTP